MKFAILFILLLLSSCDDAPQNPSVAPTTPPTSGPVFELPPFDQTKVSIQGDLGAVYAGKNDLVYLSIKNDSGRDINLLQISGLGWPFSLAGSLIGPGPHSTCVNPLRSGADCQIWLKVEAITTLGPVVGSASLDFSEPLSGKNYSEIINLTADVRDLGKLSAQPDVNFGTLLSGGPALVKRIGLRNDSLYETASNIVVELPIGSKFSVVPPICDSLAPQATCEVGISFDPVVPMAAFSEDIQITYELKGQSFSVASKLKAESKDASAPQITVDAFANKKVDFQDDIEIGLSVAIPTTALNTASNITINPKLSSFSLVNDLAKSTCLGSTLSAGQSCRLVLKHAGINQNTAITNQVIDVMYNTPQKAVSVTLNGSFVLVKPIVNGNGFTPITVDFANKANINLTVTNPNGSSFASIGTINLLGLPANVSYKPTSSCLSATLAPGNSCTFDLETNNLTANTTVNAPATLRYSSKGSNLTENLVVSGQINVKPLSEPTITGHNFGPLNIGFNDEAEIIINVTNPAPVLGNSSFPISNIVPTAIPPGLNYQAASTCNGIALAVGNSCTIIFKTDKLTASKTLVAQNVVLGYQANTVNRTNAFQLNGQINVSSIPAPNLAGNNFGTLNIVSGDKVRIVLPLTNSTTFDLSDFSSGHVDWVVDPTTTCPTAGNLLIPALAPAANCNLVLESALGFTASKVVNDTVRIPYRVANILNHFVDVTLSGNINVPVTHSITVTGGVGLPAFSIPNGGDFEVGITVTNSGSQPVKNFELKRENPNTPGLANALTFDPGYYITVDAAQTTCAAGSIAPGASCKFVLSFAPTQGANFQRKLFVLYDDNASTTTYNEEHSINVSWNFSIGIPAFTPCANPNCQPWAENANAPTEVNVSAASPGEYYNYTYREEKKAPLVLITYAQSWWNKLANAWFYSAFKNAFPQHMPWTFKPNNTINVQADGVVERLIDIVPDRVVVAGKEYVKLYHGTSIGGAAKILLNLFKTGRDALAFNRASTIALGQGLYLAANANESKQYGCMKSTDFAVAPGSGEKTMMLVVGVQAIPEIVGKQSSNYISTNLAAAGGNPAPADSGLSRQKDIYFKRNSISLGGANSGMANQFVFFEQVKPYLRILEIIVFDDLHYADQIQDGNSGLGYQRGDPSVPTSTCNYK